MVPTLDGRAGRLQLRPRCPKSDPISAGESDPQLKDYGNGTSQRVSTAERVMAALRCSMSGISRNTFPLKRKLFGERQHVHAVDGLLHPRARRDAGASSAKSGCGKSTAGQADHAADRTHHRAGCGSTALDVTAMTKAAGSAPSAGACRSWFRTPTRR